MVNVDNLHASGVTGFTGLERIVPSPSATIVRMVNVDDLHASGAAGFTGQASYPCPARGAVARAGSRFTSAGVDSLLWTVSLLLGWLTLASPIVVLLFDTAC